MHLKVHQALCVVGVDVQPEMQASIRKALKPDGMVVLLEYREEDPDVPIKPLHKMSKAQVDKEMKANGFKLVKSFDKLRWQHMLLFGIDTAAQLAQAAAALAPTGD